MTRTGSLPAPARVLVTCLSVAGAGAAIVAIAAEPPVATLDAATFLLLAVAAAWVRVPLPVVGNLSPAYAFVFAALMGFGLGASVATSVLSAAAASAFHGRKHRGRDGWRVAFQTGLAGLASVASGCSYIALGGGVGGLNLARDLVPILAYTAVFSACNVGFPSLLLRLSGRSPAAATLRSDIAWSLPGFLAGSSLAALVALLMQRSPWSLLLAAPFVYLMHLAYRARSDRAEEERRRSERSVELHRSVTEALAMAIEAKDESTRGHLRRVGKMCLAIADAAGLPRAESELLGTAALLHDVGKIAVPEHILTKPGRLTPEEAEKVRAHARVGAEILSAARFPLPLAPIVRHHHERWDGQGYPDRLAGEAIPVGARVLAVADCLDALTSDRPYRKALSREEAVAFLRRESGRMFDPDVVRILLSRPEILEAAVEPPEPSPCADAAGSPAPVHADGGAAPAAGSAAVFEEISASQREQNALYEIASVAGRALDLDEMLALLAAKTARLIPYRSLVVYLLRRGRRQLVPRFATGQAADRIKSLTIPVGDRLSGWSVLHRRAYVGRAHETPLDRDGSRSDLEGLGDDPEVAELRSALVAPLLVDEEPLGVLALYHVGSFSYGGEHLRLLQAVAGHAARTVSIARRSGRIAASLTDPATGIPNSRFFFLETAYRIGRARDGSVGFGILAFRLAERAEVEDALGPTAAGRLRAQAARRLAALTREGETLVTFGGDQFLILAPCADDDALRSRAGELVLAVQAEPVETRLGVLHPITVHATHATYPSDGETAEQLLDSLERKIVEAMPRTGDAFGRDERSGATGESEP